MFIIYKNLGETPLEALERIRKEKGILPDVPMTYAGRLDPMAEGVMIVLVGEECKEKAEYTGLSKTYEFEILSGVSTDTYDLLGLVTEMDFGKSLDSEKVNMCLEQSKKKFVQKYPPYSSKTFEGKQLHAHAREGNAPEVSHEVELFSFEFLGEEDILPEELLKIIKERIALVHGDFRQEEIIKKWEEIFSSNGAAPKAPLRITRFRVSVSSGFYIRQLVHDVSAYFNVPTVTFHIKRTKIGTQQSE